MKSVVWLGPNSYASRIEPLLAELDLTLVFAANARDALNLASLRAAVALVIAVEPSQLAQTVAYVVGSQPAAQVLVAAPLNAPAWLQAALDAGARDLYDLTPNEPRKLTAALERAATRYKHARQERELLTKIQALNEEFLKGMITLDRRNMELAEMMQAEFIDDGPAQVLVIDDEPAIAGLIEIVLKDRGYGVQVAYDGTAALAAFRSRTFHVVITDKNLPGQDGIAIMREVKMLRPETDVILITAYGSKESAIAALNCGATAYLEKPFDDIDDIGRKVDAIIATQRARQKKQEFLRLFKERNRSFLAQYKSIRGELESWLETQG